jgi:hypothetical protein
VPRRIAEQPSYQNSVWIKTQVNLRITERSNVLHWRQANGRRTFYSIPFLRLSHRPRPRVAFMSKSERAVLKSYYANISSGTVVVQSDTIADVRMVVDRKGREFPKMY